MSQLSKKYQLKISKRDTLWHLIDKNDGAWDSTGLMSATVDHEYNLLPQATIPIKLGNLLTESFKNIWENANALKDIRYNINHSCSKCEYFRNCRGNRSLAYAFFGDLRAPDPQCWKIYDDNFNLIPPPQSNH